jgi:hypothetical protein
MPGHVFINYRRSDCLAEAQELKRELQERIKGVDVYLDIDENRGGEHYIDRINDEIRDRRVFICMIGPRWLEPAAADSDERPLPRIRQKDDLVRKEIEAAILRNKQILPVRVGDVDMPTREALPDTLFMLPEKHARPLRQGRHRQGDFNAIANDVRRMLKSESKWQKWRERAAVLGWGLLLTAFLGNAGFVLGHALFPDSWLARKSSDLGGMPAYRDLLEAKTESDRLKRESPLREQLQQQKFETSLTQLTLDRERLREERDQLQRKLAAVDHGGVPHSPEAAMAILRDYKGLLDQERERASRLAEERDRLRQIVAEAGGVRSGAEPQGKGTGATIDATAEPGAPRPLQQRLGLCFLTRGQLFGCP